MKAVYYSKYFDKREGGYSFVHKEGDISTYCNFPFQLYRAAVCKDLSDERYVPAFIRRCYEAMDMPGYRIGNYTHGEPYEDSDYKVRVTPTKHFYEATNSYDGVFVIDNKYYVIGMEGIRSFQTWEAAVDFVFHKTERPEHWLQGIIYKRE